MSNTVLSKIDADGNATLVLNRPEVHNAFDGEMTRTLTAALRELDADPGVRSVTLSGAGRSFCAGADIGQMKVSAACSRQQNFEAAQASAAMFAAIYDMSKPTIACVHGAVRGGGMGIVAACDIAIAAHTATFRLSEVKIGVIPAMISPYVIAAIGARQARRYFITGEEFDAAEACRIGLVHETVTEEALQAAVERMRKQLHSSGPQAVAAAKRLIPLSAHANIDQAIRDETSHRIADIRASAEGQEGLGAFLEKRKPSWVEKRAAPAAAPHTAGQ